MTKFKLVKTKHLQELGFTPDVVVAHDGEYATEVQVKLHTDQVLLIHVTPDYKDNPSIHVNLIDKEW